MPVLPELEDNLAEARMYQELVLAKQYDEVDLVRLLILTMIFETSGYPQLAHGCSVIAEVAIKASR